MCLHESKTCAVQGQWNAKACPARAMPCSERSKRIITNNAGDTDL